MPLLAKPFDPRHTGRCYQGLARRKVMPAPGGCSAVAEGSFPPRSKNTRSVVAASLKPKLDRRHAADRLTMRRRRAAEHRFRCYDFGCEILSCGNWTQHGRDSGHWRRLVKLRANFAEVEVVFAVSFATSTNHMIEAYAETVGNPPLLVGQWSDDERRDS